MTTRNHRIRFCDNNLAAGAAATVTASSAQAAYPIANLTNSYRFKRWKPNGNFTISTSNNKLYINDGADKTITLTSGQYTGTTLAAHIQTQLNASSSSWTCTFSSNRFTVQRGGGIGVTRILRLSQQTAAVWDTIGYTTTSDIPAPLQADSQRNHTSEYVDIDLGVASAITFVALLGPLGETFSLSTTATVRLYGNTTSTMTAPALTVTLTPDTHGIYQFLDDLADTTYRYWRLEFIDRTNSVGGTGFEFGHIYLGDYTTIERRNVANRFTKTVEDTATSVQSQGGALFFQTGVKYTTFDGISIGYLDARDRRTIEQAFYDLGMSTPFYVSLDPTLLVSEDASEYTRYVIFGSKPVFTQIKFDVYSVSLSFREVM